MNDREIIQEFLLESAENLARMDQEMVQLEKEPDNRELLASIFRTIHTIKGTSGFFAFNRLQTLTHAAEDILAELRDGTRKLDEPTTTLILDSVDATRRMLASIESDEGEGQVFEQDLISRLHALHDSAHAPAPEPAVQNPVPPPPDASVPPPSSGTAAPADTTLRVDVGLLDRLMNLVGELVLTRNQLAQYNGGRQSAALNAITQRLSQITSELQGGVMKTRMQPIGVVWNKLPRVVRDLASSLQKQIVLEMDGAGTELDRTLVEAIKDPLTHIVRNSCDHGIELPQSRSAAGKSPQGRLMLRAWHEGGHVNIEIADDGAGIDPRRVKSKAVEHRLITEEQAAHLPDRDAVNLVFLPGFSTAEAVTSISGRGVGMDVVRTHIERIGGAVDLASQRGRGTTVRIRIPLTLAIVPGLVVRAGGERFIVPQINLHELIQLRDGEGGIEYVHSSPVLRYRGALLPVTDLCGVLGLVPRRRPGEASIVVVEAGPQRFGLIVDEVCDSQDIVVKPLGQQLKPLSCYAGATIMGDGRIALILDVPGLAARAGVIETSTREETVAAPAPAVEAVSNQRTPLLVFRAGSFCRLAVPLGRVARLEKIAARHVERASGSPVVQYRGRILPLIDLRQLLEVHHETGDTLRVVVFHNGSGEIGLVVNEIVDIVEEAILDLHPSSRAGILGSAIVGGHVTDLVDLDSIAQSAPETTTEGLRNMTRALSAVPQFPAGEVLA